MFNPKENLLDQQLAVSGLEMHWVGAAISAGTALVGGIMGASEASKQNAAAKKAEEEQRKLNEKIARKTNKHNLKTWKAGKKDYEAQWQYDYDTEIKQQNYRDLIQDITHARDMAAYARSKQIEGANLALNARGEAVAMEGQVAQIEEAFIQQGFQARSTFDNLKQTLIEKNIDRQEQGVKLMGIRDRKSFGNLSFQNAVEQLATTSAISQETAMVESLIAEGSIQTRQAGKSTAKALQGNTAALQTKLRSLRSEFSGKYKDAAIQLAQLNAEADLQEIGVGLNLDRIDAAIDNANTTAQFNLDVMRENMKSTIAQGQRAVEEIRIRREVADINTRAATMIKPTKLPYAPRYEPPPKRTFVKPMEVMPGYVPPAQKQSVMAPLIKGIGSAAGSIASADFSKDWLGRDPLPSNNQTSFYGSNIQSFTPSEQVSVLSNPNFKW